MNRATAESFLAYFRNLLDVNDDSRLSRAVINRAYLAAYVHIRQALEQLGYKFPGSHEDYRLVEDYLTECTEQDGPGISQRLRWLREQRVNADYDYSPTYSVSRKKARKMLRCSKLIIEDADDCLP